MMIRKLPLGGGGGGSRSYIQQEVLVKTVLKPAQEWTMKIIFQAC